MIRNIVRPHCCSGEGLGWTERFEAARPGKGGLGDVGLGTRGWWGEMERDSGGGAGWCGWVGGGGGQTWAWAWLVGRMGRAGTAQGEHSQQRWRKPPDPIAAAFW